MAESSRFGKSAAAIASIAMALALAACSGGGSTAGSSGAAGGTQAAGKSAGTAATGAASDTAKLPPGDTCNALAAADFTPLGLTLLKSDHGLSNVPEICFYQVQAADGTTASPSVSFMGPNDFEAGQLIYNKSTYQYKTVDGIGDAAFEFTTLDPVIYVKAKGYVFNVADIGLGGTVGSGDPTADIETLAKAVISHL
ncbi:MAG TPA: hypothetical protein VF337_06300 [Candidatus Limnocylindrales bacterium]